MSFPIIGTEKVWAKWNNFGSGAWRMWFMAPYGSWIYAGFVRDLTTYLRKINIGPETQDYDISEWTFGLVTNHPGDIFVNEVSAGHPDGALGMGCIRGDSPPYLYLAGRSDPDPNPDSIIQRFDLSLGFEVDGSGGLIPCYTNPISTDVISVLHICGLEVLPGSGLFVVTNNRDGREFEIRRYDEAWDGGLHAPSHTVALSGQYMENNSLARVRGVAHASDGNILVFVNDGGTATSCRVLKFAASNLDFLGHASWSPGITATEWGYIVQSGEVFLFFRGLDDASVLKWKNAIYYDRATGIPDGDKSNFIIADNLTSFGAEEAVQLRYEARDAFNVPVVNAPTEFVINNEDKNDPSTWTDRLGGIQSLDTADFFDEDGVPLAISAIVNTSDPEGVATAYYKSMRSGSGTEIDVIDVFCPASL